MNTENKIDLSKSEINLDVVNQENKSLDREEIIKRTHSLYWDFCLERDITPACRLLDQVSVIDEDEYHCVLLKPEGKRIYAAVFLRQFTLEQSGPIVDDKFIPEEDCEN